MLSFPPPIAPTKVLLVPLSNHPDFRPLVSRMGQKLRRLGISNRVDDSSATIGKRYSRNDELGTPLGITVDFQSVKDNTFTLRDRDSTKQVRSDEDTICAASRALLRAKNRGRISRKNYLNLLSKRRIDYAPMLRMASAWIALSAANSIM